jgi:hypothetical protein
MPSVIKSIQTYGEDIVVINDNDTIPTRAFVEPLRYRNVIYVGGEYKNIGLNYREKYLYVSIPDIPLVENKTIIERKDEKYLVKRVEKYYVKEQVAYTWAILIPA